MPTTSQPTGINIENISLRVTTPMFLGGVPPDLESHPVGELRPPSIKGVMRFWHRATGMDALRSEARIFGSVSGRNRGQGAFLLQLVRNFPSPTSRADFQDAGLKYLAYGMYDTQGQSGPKDRRRYIDSEQLLQLRLVFQPWADEKTRKAVRRSLRLLTLFGGLGARSRRGFGSVRMHTDRYRSPKELFQVISDELGAVLAVQREPSAGLPDYTMFSRHTRVLFLRGRSNWKDSLNEIGSLLSNFRKATHRLGTSAKPNPWTTARQDVNLIRGFLSGHWPTQAPARAAFGLPHNYDNLSFREHPNARKVFVGNNVRRASPLFFHVHRVGDYNRQSYPIVVTYMPALWFPNDEEDRRRIEMTDEHSRIKQSVPPPSMQAVEDFLQHLLEHGAEEVSV